MRKDIFLPTAFAGKVPVYTRNELMIAAEPEAIWRVLIDAESWSEWYVNCRKLKMQEPPNLKLGTLFNWVTFGVRVHTQVVAFEPHRYLAWQGTGLGAAGYHSWSIEQVQKETCRVITEEYQTGAVPWLFRHMLKKGLLYYHNKWLKGLEKRARCNRESTD